VIGRAGCGIIELLLEADMKADWITTDEAQKLTGYHPVHLRKLLLSGKIKGQKWGRQWQVSRSSLGIYLKRIKVLGGKRGPKGST